MMRRGWEKKVMSLLKIQAVTSNSQEIQNRFEWDEGTP